MRHNRQTAPRQASSGRKVATPAKGRPPQQITKRRKRSPTTPVRAPEPLFIAVGTAPGRSSQARAVSPASRQRKHGARSGGKTPKPVPAPSPPPSTGRLSPATDSTGTEQGTATYQCGNSAWTKQTSTCEPYCSADTDCAAPKPACKTSTNKCEECTSNSHCFAPTPYCDTTTNTCVACTPVDGGWGPWSGFSQCKNGCYMEDKRSCNNPAPSCGGNYCVGSGYSRVGCHSSPNCYSGDPCGQGYNCTSSPHGICHGSNRCERCRRESSRVYGSCFVSYSNPNPSSHPCGLAIGHRSLTVYYQSPCSGGDYSTSEACMYGTKCPSGQVCTGSSTSSGYCKDIPF